MEEVNPETFPQEVHLSQQEAFAFLDLIAVVNENLKEKIGNVKLLTGDRETFEALSEEEKQEVISAYREGIANVEGVDEALEALRKLIANSVNEVDTDNKS